MPIVISSAFDVGNIRVATRTETESTLKSSRIICRTSTNGSISAAVGAAGRAVTLRIVNCEQAAYPNGWPDYKAVMSHDREDLGADRRYAL